MRFIDLRNSHVERRLISNLQQLLQLQFVVHQLTLDLHDIIFILSPLGSQLCQVGLRHLAHIDHLLTAFLILLTGLKGLFTHFHTLIQINNLGENLGDTFLNAVGSLLR